MIFKLMRVQMYELYGENLNLDEKIKGLDD